MHREALVSLSTYILLSGPAAALALFPLTSKSDSGKQNTLMHTVQIYLAIGTFKIL